MDFEQLSTARYSLRKFSSKPIEQEKLDLILKAAQAAPTALNIQPQHIFVIKSPQALEKARRCTEFHFFAPMLLVIAYDESVSWHREEDGMDLGVIDAAIAAAHIMLQAAELSLGTTYVGGYDSATLAKEFPEIAPYRIVGLLPIGYPAEGAHPARLHTMRKPISELVTYL